MRNFTRSAVAVAVITLCAGPSFAQSVPPDQSCGGLLCDMGVFGHKIKPGPNGEPATPAQVQEQVAAAEAADPHRLPCHDFLCRAFGQKDADAAPPPPPASAPAPVAEVEKPTKHAHKTKRKHVANADAPAPEAAK